MHDTPDLADDAPNEILAAAKAHARVAKQAAVEKAKSWPLARIGFAAGIGSAAVAAAVLYQRRRERDGR